jgi:hypothetical protein
MLRDCPQKAELERKDAYELLLDDFELVLRVFGCKESVSQEEVKRSHLFIIIISILYFTLN